MMLFEEERIMGRRRSRRRRRKRKATHRRTDVAVGFALKGKGDNNMLQRLLLV
jgi:hypothetical protein